MLVRKSGRRVSEVDAMLSAVCLGLSWVPLEHELEYMYACAYLASSSRTLPYNKSMQLATRGL